MSIMILGPMGVGKTSVGRALAERRGIPFVDSDLVIETEEGFDAAEIARRRGVAALHQLELRVAMDVCRADRTVVAALAASVADNLAALAELSATGATLVYLDAPSSNLDQMASSGSHRRPIASDDAAALAHARRANAVSAGAVVVERGDDEIVTAIRLEEALATPR